MSNDEPSRRRFLRVAGGATTIAIAGCAGGNSENEETPDGAANGESMETTETMGDSMETTETMGGDSMAMEPTDPAMAERVTVDRFSETAGTLHVRGPDNDLPGAGEPIDFDANFLTQGFGPDGGVVDYYDFDAQPTEPAPIYAFFYENGDPVEDQRNVIGVVPGDEGYNDFWHVQKVTVPDDYQANAVTSASTLMDAGFDIETTNVIKNCPVVPEGSTASMRHGDGDTGLVQGWYEDKVANYFLFEEAPLESMDSSVPLSPIYVSFNVDPGQDGGGPSSGFMTEEMSSQTHNVLATTPSDDAYSPLWLVNVYDNDDFESVSDLDSASSAEILASGAAMVNCPVVSTA